MTLSHKTIAYSTPLVKVLAVFLLIFLATCSGQPDPQAIIDKSIAVQGGDKLDKSVLSFKFRNRIYKMKRENGLFTYERIFTDSLGSVRDILTNKGFVRLRDNDTVSVSDDYQRRYSNSVNSVIYFALLPYGLNDPAVNKQFLGETIIEGKPYYEIEVTFDKKGGGEDFNDVFVYWINQQTYTMDYFAYAFQTDGGGSRFRKAINPRVVKGVRFVDYINYDYSGDSVSLDTYEKLFEAHKLQELSRIKLEDIVVSLQ